MIKFELGSGPCIDWAEDKLGCTFRDDKCCFGNILDDGRIRSSVILDTFSNTNCVMSVVSDQKPGAITKEQYKRVFYHIFGTNNLRRVTAYCDKENFKAIKYDLHVGYKIEGVMRHLFPDTEEVLVMGILKEECRFLKSYWRNKDGQEK